MLIMYYLRVWCVFCFNMIDVHGHIPPRLSDCYGLAVSITDHYLTSLGS